jgi:hypothetical protein
MFTAEELKKLQDDANKYLPGLVGISEGYLGRYSEFSRDLHQLIVPAGSDISHFISDDNTLNLNGMVQMVKTKKLSWLCIMKDDCMFNPDILINLLSRNVDIVAPLCLRRVRPFLPILHGTREENFKRMGWEIIRGKLGLLDWTNKSCGISGMVVQKKVFEVIPEPCFQAGKLDAGVESPGFYFCYQLPRYNLKLWVDLDNVIGNMTTGVVWPKKNEKGEWTVDLRTP